MNDKEIYKFLSSQGWEENYVNKPYKKYYRFRVPTDAGWEFFYLDRSDSDAKLCMHSRFSQFSHQFRNIYGVELGGKKGSLLLKSADMLDFEKTVGRTGDDIPEFFPLRFFTVEGLTQAVSLISEKAKFRLPLLARAKQPSVPMSVMEDTVEKADDLHGFPPAENVAKDIDCDIEDQEIDWSWDEIVLAVSDYFAMLAKEAGGEPLNKAEHNAALRPQLNGRSKGSVEFKHQNISGVLLDLGLPYIRGYKPLGNYQQALRECVTEFIIRNPRLIDGILQNYESSLPGEVSSVALSKVDPPSIASVNAKGGVRQRLPRKLDFPALDEQNRALGLKGEEWVFRYEQQRLLNLGLPNLANLIEWTSQDKGDGTGYDIQSFNEDGSTRYIEVKTTNAGASTPFYVSQNELDFSEEVGESFFIYRVFDFSTDPKFYELRGALTITAHLEATAYRARPLSKAELVLEKEAVPDESDL